ncbi:MAG: cytochrome c biogenesis protein [Desulfurococcales archaeon]|nr:cytochrome c biogenesis protein [Desulfurococcales archaeon]
MLKHGVVVSGGLFAALVALLLLADLSLALYAVLQAPFPAVVPLGTPMAYKNIYLHVPIAVSTYVLFAGALVSALMYMRTESLKWARRMDSFVLYGILYAAATLATGSAWASESWGTPWNWDPKQTAVLFLFLAFLGYYPLKKSIPDPERRWRVLAAYVTAAFVLVPMSFMASRAFESLHPTTEALEQYTEGGPGGLIVGLRITMLMALGLALAFARAEGLKMPRVLAALPLLFLALAFAAGFAGGVGSEGDRVVSVALGPNGTIASIALASGENVTFNPPVESPIRPPVVERNGTIASTLLGHLVDAGPDGLRVLYHWSTPFTFIVYTILLAAGIILAGGSGRDE